jgi:hypothetical protein
MQLRISKCTFDQADGFNKSGLKIVQTKQIQKHVKQQEPVDDANAAAGIESSIQQLGEHPQQLGDAAEAADPIAPTPASNVAGGWPPILHPQLDGRVATKFSD